MKDKDIKIKVEIENILQNESSGLALKSYFENIPENRIRRSLHILSSIYPGKTKVSDDDFSFISYMITNEKFLKQDNFFEFIFSLTIIDFTEIQKKILSCLIKEHFEKLCEACTFELDSLLVKIFDRSDLFRYVETLSDSSNISVLRRISDILRYEDFSDTNVSNEALEALKNKISCLL